MPEHASIGVNTYWKKIKHNRIVGDKPKQVEGFHEVKVEKFGQYFLDRIKELLDEFEKTEQNHVDPEKLTQKLPEPDHPTLSNPLAKVPVIKRKNISYEDEEEEHPTVCHSNQDTTVTVCEEEEKESEEPELWGDDIDESCLAGVLDETMVSTTTESEQQSETGGGDDVWGEEEDWLTENNDLEKNLLQLETEALSTASPSYKKKIQVKRKPISYDSDEESTDSVSPVRREMTKEEKFNKEYNRKKRLKMLLS